jgi:hypothetical protein
MSFFERNEVMKSSTAITTVITMMETLPEPLQILVVEHLKEYLADLQDEWQWDRSFQQTQTSLSEASRRAKQERADGLATPMDYEKL